MIDETQQWEEFLEQVAFVIDGHRQAYAVGMANAHSAEMLGQARDARVALDAIQSVMRYAPRTLLTENPRGVG